MRVLWGLAVFLAANACAQNLYWDANSGTAGLQSGDGTWNTSTFWNSSSTGAATPQGWTNGGNVNFSGGSSTVDLEGTTWNVGQLAWTGAITVTLNHGGNTAMVPLTLSQ